MIMKIIFSRAEINLGRSITSFYKKCRSVFWLNRRLPDSYVCFCRLNLLQFHVSCYLWKTALYMHRRKSEKSKILTKCYGNNFNSANNSFTWLFRNAPLAWIKLPPDNIAHFWNQPWNSAFSENRHLNLDLLHSLLSQYNSNL